MPSRWRLSAESITAAAAVATAVVALAVGVWQTAETRRHNRLSVRPHLEFRVTAVDRPDSLAATVTVRNQGIGPAEIREAWVGVETQFGGPVAYATWDEAAPAIEAFGVALGSRATVSEGVFLEPGASLALLELRDAGAGSLDSLLAVARRLDVRLAYESLYREPFEAALWE